MLRLKVLGVVTAFLFGSAWRSIAMMSIKRLGHAIKVCRGG